MNPTPPFDSAVVKALLLAIVGLVGIVGSFFGIDEAVFNAKASRVVDGLLLLATAFGVFWALYGRLFMRTPPLTQTAVKKTEEAAGIKPEPYDPAHPPSPPSQPQSHWLIGMLTLVAAIVIMLGMTGCKTTPPAAEVIKESCARDEQYSTVRCAQGLAATYEVYQESVLRIVRDPIVEPAIKDRLRSLDAALTPVMVAGLRLTAEYRRVEIALAAGETTEEQLIIANRELETWIVSALPKITALREALGL